MPKPSHTLTRVVLSVMGKKNVSMVEQGAIQLIH
uniref:Uncharacterized protein n=1 Tax=Anguilla anguilla TaxID=7936 RepID=A0A0E9XRP5_ANGAN